MSARTLTRAGHSRVDVSPSRRTRSNDFLADFRQAAPYIRAHRGKTFVLVFGGEAMRSRGLPDLMHDIALLHSLGIRLVLVAGSRPQIERRLQERGKASRMVDGSRVTDEHALAAAKEAAGVHRVELERLLTLSQPGSPMAGARLRVAAGNFVTARPVGVIDGVDFRFTGRVRRIDHEAIRERLDREAIVILTPLGYSLTGDAFNLSTPDLAAETAVAIGAEKLIALCEARTWKRKGAHVSELTLDELRNALASKRGMQAELRPYLEAARTAVSGGVPRAHILARKMDGALVRELFTRDGVGTVIATNALDAIRAARQTDIPALLRLLAPLEAQGVLVARPRELLEESVERFRVLERDGQVLACVALHPFAADEVAELACLAVDPQFRQSGRGEAMVRAVEREAKGSNMNKLFVLTTQSDHFFRQLGFEPATPTELPSSREAYDRKRRSKVLVKNLG